MKHPAKAGKKQHAAPPKIFNWVIDRPPQFDVITVADITSPFHPLPKKYRGKLLFEPVAYVKHRRPCTLTGRCLHPFGQSFRFKRKTWRVVEWRGSWESESGLMDFTAAEIIP